ncbi:hypothetical protein T484DRAFT_1882162 [Baffinella frigidus]|nr:hypothetical protein T484DRAFT_1882162 [Cryptophyta sp. CCMP2293]
MQQRRGAVDYVIHGIVAAVSGVLVLFGSGVFIIQMQHPDDKNAAWLPKLIVLLGLFLTCAMVLMLPFDASMSQSCESDPECGVVGMIAQVWFRGVQDAGFISVAVVAFVLTPLAYFFLGRYAGFISVAVVAFVLIPLAYFWYETDDEDGIVTRAATTVCWSIVFCFVFVAILLALYFTMGVVDLPIIVMAPYATETTSWFVDPALARPLFKDVAAVPAFSATQSIRTSLVIYVLALLSFIGWCLMTVFAGIGMVALPMDLFIAFRDRPRPIDLKQFAERKLQLKKRCEELLAIGRQEKDAFKAKPNAFRERRFTLKYKKMVLDLEEEMTLLNICYKRNEINPLIPWIQLFGGFVSTVLTISWWIQLILEIFLDGIAGPYLSDVFTNLSAAFPLFGIVAYGVFAFYILICVVKGSIKFAGRFFLISMHPLKINGTMMNSLLSMCACYSCAPSGARSSAPRRLQDSRIPRLSPRGYERPAPRPWVSPSTNHPRALPLREMERGSGAAVRTGSWTGPHRGGRAPRHVSWLHSSEVSFARLECVGPPLGDSQRRARLTSGVLALGVGGPQWPSGERGVTSIRWGGFSGVERVSWRGLGWGWGGVPRGGWKGGLAIRDVRRVISVCEITVKKIG